MPDANLGVPQSNGFSRFYVNCGFLAMVAASRERKAVYRPQVSQREAIFFARIKPKVTSRDVRVIKHQIHFETPSDESWQRGNTLAAQYFAISSEDLDNGSCFHSIDSRYQRASRLMLLSVKPRNVSS